MLTGTAFSSRRTKTGGRESGPAEHFVAIPYYAWSHRGQHQMTVWPARTLDAAKPTPAPTLAFQSALATSGGRNPEAIKDQLLPSSSNDGSIPNFHWWPKKGTTEWVQYHFPESTTVSAVTVYWYDDTGDGDCRLPASWEIQYHDGTAWRAVAEPSSMDCVVDAPSHVTFAPVQTSDIRLMITLPSGFSSGIYEWSLE